MATSAPARRRWRINAISQGTAVGPEQAAAKIISATAAGGRRGVTGRRRNGCMASTSLLRISATSSAFFCGRGRKCRALAVYILFYLLARRQNRVAKRLSAALRASGGSGGARGVGVCAAGMLSSRIADIFGRAGWRKAAAGISLRCYFWGKRVAARGGDSSGGCGSISCTWRSATTPPFTPRHAFCKGTAYFFTLPSRPPAVPARYHSLNAAAT
jgi:hypothetical protein